MLKSKWTHMGKDLTQDFHTKASWGHNKICDYTDLLSHRHIYLDTLLAITKLKSNLKKKKNPGKSNQQF